MKIDAWNSNSFLINVDSILKSSSIFHINDDNGEHLCATSLNNDAVRSISLNFSHSSSTTTIKFMSDLTSIASIASWGFRDTIITIDSCHIRCASCSGPTSNQCLSCYSNAYLSNGMCVCTPNYYMIDIIPCSALQCSFCNLCNSPCRTCQGIAINDCLSCVGNTYLLNGVCILICPDGMFANSILLICQICDSICQTCINSSTTCTSCFSSTYLQSNQCVTSCLSGYYGDTKNSICMTCNSKCSQCDKTAIHCTSCNSPYYLNPGGICHSNCPSGYAKNHYLNTCETCSFLCSTCLDSINLCLTCSYPYYFLSSNCLSSCPDGMFEDKTNRLCLPCDDKCSICIGYSSNCTTCQINYVLEENKCLNNCSRGKYFSSNSSICENCNSNCLTCEESRNKCTSCPKNMFLQKNICVENCNEDEFVDNSTNCQLCDAQCKTCKGDSLNCLQCKNLSLYANEGSCQTSCPALKYGYQPTKQCFLCYNTCEECYGESENNCFGCYSGNYLYQNKCWDSCPDLTYGENDICLNCTENCKKCSSFNNCMVCNAYYYVNVSGNCEKQIEIEIKLLEIYNPFSFKIEFKSNDTLDLAVISQNLEMNIYRELNGKKFTSNFTKIVENEFIYLEISYKEFLSDDSLLSLSSKDSNNNSFYIYFENATAHLIAFSVLCNNSNSYYDNSSKTCKIKQTLSFYLKYSDSSTKYMLKTSGLSNEQTLNVTHLFKLNINNVTNFTYQIKNTNENLFEIDFNFEEDIINGPYLTVSFNLLTEDLLFQHINIQNEDYQIKMIDYYMMSSIEQEISSSTNALTVLADIFNLCNLYINIILNGNSSFLIQGLMLLNLIYILKFLQINFPPNVSSMFKSRSVNNLFPIPKIEIDENDLLILPQNFRFYEVSEYYINNEASNIVQLFMIFFLAYTCLTGWRYAKNQYKLTSSKRYRFATLLLKFFKKIFIWSIFFNTIFSKYQGMVFFTTTSIKFPPLSEPKGLLNILMAIFNLLFLIFLPIHIYKLLFMMKSIDFPQKNKVIPLEIQKENEIIASEFIDNQKGLDISFEMENIAKDQSLKKIEDLWKMDEKTPSYNSANLKQMFASEQIIKHQNNYISPPESPRKLINLFDEENNDLNSPKNKLPFSLFPSDSIKIITSNSKIINIMPVQIMDDDQVKDDWRPAIVLNSERNVGNKPVEKLPQSKEFLEANIGISIQEKIQKGAITNEEVKSLRFLFNGNASSPLISLDVARNTPQPFRFRPKDDKKKLSFFSTSPRNKRQINPVPIIIGENSIELHVSKRKENIKKHSVKFFVAAWNMLKKVFICMSYFRNSIKKFYDPAHCNSKRFKKRFFFLSAEFKQNNNFQRFFLLIDFLRHFFIMFFIVAFYGQVIIQISLITAINLCFFLFLLVSKPYKKKNLMFLTFFNEIIINIILICVLKLAIYDENDQKDSNSRQQLGWAILFSNLILMYSLVGLTVFKIGKQILVVIRFVKLKRNAKMQSPQKESGPNLKTTEKKTMRRDKKKESTFVGFWGI